MRNMSVNNLVEKGVIVDSLPEPRRAWDNSTESFSDIQETRDGVKVWQFDAGVASGFLVERCRVQIVADVVPQLRRGDVVTLENAEVYIAGNALALRCDGVSSAEDNLDDLMGDD